MRKWILLIQLHSTSLLSIGSKGRYKFPPLGLLCISSMLRLHGYVVRIIDLLSFGKNTSYLLKRIRDLKEKHKIDPLISGFTVFTENVNDAIITSIELKKIFPKTLIVFGGAHAKAAYEELLQNGAADIVSLVEGEGHILEIAKYAEGLISLDEIRGIAYLKDGHIEVNDRFFLHDLDLLPLPDFLNVKYSNYRQVGILVTSRGCPGRCIFCASRQFSGSKYRASSAKRVFAEIMFLYLYFRIKDFGIMDDTFTVLKKRTKEFCMLLKRHLKEKIGYAIKSRVDLLNEETLSYLRETNCSAIHIGVESADNKVLKIMKKGITIEKSLDIIEKIASFGIVPECSFIIGNPGDTPETIYKTLFMVYLLNKYFILYPPAAVAICTPYPGTELALNYKNFEMNIIVKDWRRYDSIQPIFETKDFSAAFIRETMWNFNRDPNSFIQKIKKEHPSLEDFYNRIEKKIKNAAEKYMEARKEDVKKCIPLNI
ncbi:MAG: radical SAM protein [candidate division WOR-3 bacterium]